MPKQKANHPWNNAYNLCKKNEDFHKTNPNNTIVLGLDPVLGDVVIEKDEYPLIRGG